MSIEPQPWLDARRGMTQVRDSVWRDEDGVEWIWTQVSGWMPGDGERPSRKSILEATGASPTGARSRP